MDGSVTLGVVTMIYTNLLEQLVSHCIPAKHDTVRVAHVHKIHAVHVIASVSSFQQNLYLWGHPLAEPRAAGSEDPSWCVAVKFFPS